MLIDDFFSYFAIQPKEKALYVQALTHRSFSKDNNERLEYLGDAVLDLVIGEALYQQYPQAREGELSRFRAELVNTQFFAEKSRQLQLSSLIRLGSGEKKAGGADKDSILADALEALFGAMYLDLGFMVTQQAILHLFTSDIHRIAQQAKLKDSKTELQEYLQAAKLSLPSYDLIRRDGKEHQQTFTIECQVASLQLRTSAQGTSKKNAEQQAAKAMLALLAQRKLS